mmetsp:Transcript_21894/g.49941  ORF Transcript_21894/g.49941 Transcript_21894/m.49941 type:complete len:234 (-) Transcript_21894:909-1610(-)
MNATNSLKSKVEYTVTFLAKSKMTSSGMRVCPMYLTTAGKSSWSSSFRSSPANQSKAWCHRSVVLALGSAFRYLEHLINAAFASMIRPLSDSRPLAPTPRIGRAIPPASFFMDSRFVSFSTDAADCITGESTPASPGRMKLLRKSLDPRRDKRLGDLPLWGVPLAEPLPSLSLPASSRSRLPGGTDSRAAAYKDGRLLSRNSRGEWAPLRGEPVPESFDGDREGDGLDENESR